MIEKLFSSLVQFQDDLDWTIPINITRLPFEKISIQPKNETKKMCSTNNTTNKCFIQEKG